MYGLEVAVHCVTKPEKNSWIIISFTCYIIKPTHYSMRHYSTWDTEALRTWTFEGSCDGVQTWKLLECDNNNESSHFRILPTDFHSNRHYYLASSGFEIYGAMKDMDDIKQQHVGGGGNNKKGSLTFLLSYDFDTNDIIYWLGSSRGIRKNAKQQMNAVENKSTKIQLQLLHKLLKKEGIHYNQEQEEQEEQGQQPQQEEEMDS